MKTPKRLKGAETPLEIEVQDIINDQVYSNSNELVPWLQNLFQHGCVSGRVSALIYYKDTVKFYQEHQDEIDSLLKEMLSETGLSVEGLFGDKWDKDDMFCREQYNQNLLAWFGFEETARRLADKNGTEV